MPSKLLCYGIGNISRGDDALGPQLVHWLKHNRNNFPGYSFTLESPFQLQPENIYEFKTHDAIIFLDADARFQRGIKFIAVTAVTNSNPFVSHALPPEQLLNMHNELLKYQHPQAFLLSMGAGKTELIEALSEQAEQNLEAAKAFLSKLLQQPITEWQV